MNGMYDLPNFAETGRFPTLKDAAFADRAAMEEGSPIRYVRPGAPPIMIVYGENDLFTLREGSQAFYSALIKQGLYGKVFLYQAAGRTHYNTLSGMGRAADQIEDVVAPMAIQLAGRELGVLDKPPSDERAAK